MILCCGEALIDMLPQHDPATGQRSFLPHCGGAAHNSAIALGRLGEQVALVSGLSTDLFGDQLRQELEASGASAALAITSDRPTTLAFVTLEGGNARYAFWDQGSAMREIAIADLPEFPAQAKALLFGGISLCNTPMADSFLHLARSQQGKRCIMLDLNIRPGFAVDEPAYRRRLLEMIALSDIVKLSQEDLHHFLPGPEAETEKLRAFCDMAPAVVLFTRGADGAVVITPQGARIEARAEAVSVVDTVGAGDSFNAGFLAVLSETGSLSAGGLGGLDQRVLSQAVQFAVTVASCSVTRAGANPPWRHEL